MPLTPPPDELFVSLESLLDAVKAYAANHSYATTILRSKKNKKGILYKAVMSMDWMKMDLVGYPIHLHPPKIHFYPPNISWIST